MAARRGEIWFADFDPYVGHEQGGRRPALVISADAFNASGADLVTVVPITSVARPHIPSRVAVRPPEGGVSKISYIIAEQTRTISTKRLVKPLGVVSAATMKTVGDIVRMLLGL